MAKRLSSIFGISKDKESGAQHTYPAQSSSLSATPAASPVSKLHKQHRPSTPDFAYNPPVLQPPPTFHETVAGITSRPTSRPQSRDGRLSHDASDSDSVRSRPQTPVLLLPPTASHPSPLYTTSPVQNAKLAKKKSSIPTKSEKHQFDQGPNGHSSENKAWIAGLKEHIPYNLTDLLEGRVSPDLWDASGDVLVHLFPEATGRGPTFRVRSELFKDSIRLNYLYHPTPDVRHLSLASDGNFGPPPHNDHAYSSQHLREVPQNVYLPLDFEGDVSSPNIVLRGDDYELLVLYRNVFAFLAGGALVSTPSQVSLYSVFMGIATVLRKFQFGDTDGSTLGEVASNSFTKYCEELRLADVRASREKTIEALVLGESMKCWALYNEGFVHAAGRLQEIKSIRSPKFAKISPVTINRLERAALDVEGRLAQLRSKLEDFEFPSMFAGIANSQTATEAKLVRFKAWREAFVDMRKFTLTQYKRRYGSWPPKASSKKNNFEESGLNRLVVQEMYHDFCDLYDMLANPREMTTRKIDMVAGIDQEHVGVTETIQHALRVVLSEYDRATPPVMPPIPFDTPLIPTLDSSFKGATVLASTSGRVKLRPNELNDLLLGSYNREYIKPSVFVQEFMAYERKLGAGATLDQVVDYRCGQWLFLYAVLQALPMTAVDARGVQFTEGVEYFLFAAPRGGKPWMREDTTTSRMWFNVKSAGQTLSLPSDVLDHQPEGVYRRSHCWLIANQWIDEHGLLPELTLASTHGSDGSSQLARPDSVHYSPQVHAPPSTATPPHLTPSASPLVRPVTPGSNRQSLMAKSSSYASLSNIEQVAAPVRTTRPSSTYNPAITFDSILGEAATVSGKAKKKKQAK